ncbi:hypothetical protein LTR95_006692 [Oleoguttula sp. CCFEE 5521]
MPSTSLPGFGLRPAQTMQSLHRRPTSWWDISALRWESTKPKWNSTSTLWHSAQGTTTTDLRSLSLESIKDGYLGDGYEQRKWIYMAHHTTLPELLEPTAIDNALALVKKFGSIDAIPLPEVMKLNRADALALEWYERHGKSTIDRFLFEHRGLELTKTIVGKLSVEAQLVLAWGKAKPKKQYFDLTFEQYVKEKQTLHDHGSPIRAPLHGLGATHASHGLTVVPLDDIPIDITDVLHDQRRLSRNAPTMLNRETRAESFEFAWPEELYVFRVPNGPDARTVSLLDPLARWLNQRGPEVVAEISALVICCSTKPPRGRWAHGQLLHFGELEVATRAIRQRHGFQWGGEVDITVGKLGHLCDDTRGHVALLK